MSSTTYYDRSGKKYKTLEEAQAGTRAEDEAIRLQNEKNQELLRMAQFNNEVIQKRHDTLAVQGRKATILQDTTLSNNAGLPKKSVL